MLFFLIHALFPILLANRFSSPPCNTISLCFLPRFFTWSGHHTGKSPTVGLHDHLGLGLFLIREQYTSQRNGPRATKHERLRTARQGVLFPRLICARIGFIEIGLHCIGLILFIERVRCSVFNDCGCYFGNFLDGLLTFMILCILS